MSQHMEKNTRKWLVLIALVAVALLATFWALPALGFFLNLWRLRPLPQNIPGDIELFYIAKTVVSTVNVALSIILLLNYVSIYQKTRSEFTIGLIIFSMVFLMNALASNPFVIGAFGFGIFGLGPFAMLPEVFTLLALSVLLYLSIK
jgi:hypothetical protein